ncbi:MAG: hypothetical protein INR71_13765, partial [Terriglobus roseus]|nr:hypothetical protein [Terriglobus roseus]
KRTPPPYPSPRESFYIALANRAAVLASNEREQFSAAMRTLSGINDQQDPSLGMSLLEQLSALPANTWLTLATSAETLVTHNTLHRNRLRALEAVAALLDGESLASVTLAFDSLRHVRSAPRRRRLIFHLGHDVERAQLPTFLQAAEALLETDDATCHDAVAEAAKMCSEFEDEDAPMATKLSREDQAAPAQNHETFDQAAEDHQMAITMQDALYACEGVALEGASLAGETSDSDEESLPIAARGHPAEENVQDSRRLQAQTRAWAILADMVPNTLPTCSIMALVSAFEEHIVDLAKAGKHPLAAANRYDEEQKEKSTRKGWEFLNYGFHGKKTTADYMYCYTSEKDNVGWHLKNDGPITVPAFTARIWLAIHTVDRRGADRTPQPPRLSPRRPHRTRRAGTVPRAGAGDARSHLLASVLERAIVWQRSPSQ